MSVVRTAILLTFAVAAPAWAQSSGNRFELTPSVGYRFGGDLQSEDSDLFATDVTVEDSEAFGVTFDVPLGSVFQLEFLAHRQSSQLQFDDGLFGGTSDVADIDVTYYHVGFLVGWGSGQISPFVTASLGVAELSPDLPGASSESRFSASFGGGVKIFVSDHVGFRLEGRGFWTSIDEDQEDFCDYYDRCYGNEFTQGQASAGLIFAW